MKTIATKRRDEASEGIPPGVAASRRDRAINLSPPVETAEGFLRFEGFIAKPGGLTYANRGGGSRVELVRPETLHDPSSLSTLALKPVVLEHPIEGGRQVDVTPENYQRHAVGTVGESWEVMPDGRVKFGFMVTAKKAIDAIRRHGVRQLSPGYDLLYVAKPGVDKVFGRFDGEQRNRVYNHLALTLRARGGDDIGFRADSQIPRALPRSLSLGGIPVHPLFAILAAMSVDPTIIDSARQRYDALPAESQPEKRADALDAQVETLKADLAAEKKRADDAVALTTDDAMLAAFERRDSLLGLARAHRIDAADVGLVGLGNDALAKKLALAIDDGLTDESSAADVDATLRHAMKRADGEKGRADSSRAYDTAKVSDKPPERTRRDGDGEKRVDSSASFFDRIAKARSAT